MITGLSVSFLMLAVLLWLSSYGYLLVLGLLARSHRRQRIVRSTHSRVAVIVPTLNEAAYIRGKLDDLGRTEYPRDKLVIIVADGGSHDGTCRVVEDILRRKESSGDLVRLQRIPAARGKADQIARVLPTLDHDIVVVTDADARLEPSCIRELVALLAEDQQTGVVGALVYPATGLLEERLHWRLVNYLWWLEGEVLSSALVSGVCFAARREVLHRMLPGAATEDIQVALTAGASGHGVRICPTALATEIRVPQTTRELLRFRRRRGNAYLYELVRSLRHVDAPAGWRLARHVRLWHFFATPALAALFVTSAIALLWTPHWPIPLVTVAVFLVPAFRFLALSPPGDTSEYRFTQVGWAVARLAVLTWISLAITACVGWLHLPAGDSA